MLTAFGVGEAAISVSSAPQDDGPLQHTVRDVGPGHPRPVPGAASATWSACEGRSAPTGASGPEARRPIDGDRRGRSGPGGDVVVVAGGIGLAPLRGAVDELVARRPDHGGRVFVIVGARDPAQIIFGDDLEAWARDGAGWPSPSTSPAPGWTGHVGPGDLAAGRGRLRPRRRDGPGLRARDHDALHRPRPDRQGVDPRRIRVSLERNMQCGVAWCGHCQLGPFLLCRDGPVLPYAGVVAQLLTERER